VQGENVMTEFDQRKPMDRELTKDELDQIAAGVTPSIPIPPPRLRFAADNAGATDEHRATLF
jgi:hypothetical protein